MPSFAGLASQATSALSSTLSQAQTIASNVQGAAQGLLQKGQSLLSGSSLLGSLTGGLKSALPSFPTSFGKGDFGKVPSRSGAAPELASFPKFQGSFAFPIDTPKYYTRFSFKQYVRPAALQKQRELPVVDIIFPMPANLMDEYNVGYKTPELGAIVGTLSAVTEKVKSGQMNSEEAGAALRGGVSKDAIATGVARAVTKAAANVPVLGSVSEAAGAAAEKFLGTVPNPHLAVIFQNVDLRTHTFSYRFSPNTETEVRVLKDIIRRIKYAMLPGKDGGEFVLTFPDTCDISFGPKEDIPYKIKNSVLIDFKVNWAPQGLPAFFKSGDPVEVEISMTFKETEIHTREDYELAKMDRIRGGA